MDKNEMNPPRRFYIKDTDLSERRMERCGLCSLISSMLRRAMCVSSRRGSSESYYRELGDQDTLKIDDRSSEYSYNAEAEFETRPEFPTCPRTYELEKMKPKSLADSKFLTVHKRRKKRLLTRSLQKNRALLDDLLLGQVECILSQSALWKFNAFTLDVVSGGRCLPVLCVHLFQEYGLMSHFNLDAAKAWKLFSLIEEGYHSTNPYHNAIHAADVTQAMHCFLQQPRIRKNLKPIEIMASLLAAIAHDLDHPGVNQPFLIATSNHLASLYNNTSVLENHHWRSAISCLYESGLLNHMGEAWPQLEQQISSLILATDITKQHEYLSQFKSHLDMNSLDMQTAKHRHLVLQIALKCADISNPCRPWQISRKWSLKVCEEFFRQGDYERKLNLPVTALCDRHTTSIPKIQAGFFKFVVTPLIKEWDRFLNNDLSSQMFENLVYNQNKWDTLVAQEQAEETHTEISDADIVDDIASDTNISDSSELLLPPRRSSLNAVKQVSLKDQLRRFSVPLNVFQDSKFKSKAEKIQISIVVEPQKVAVDSPAGSEHSIHSQLSVGEQCEHVRETPDKFLSSEKLMPDTSIASITTSAQATRLNTVIKDSGTWKLVRQQTFPPLETRDHSLKSRSLHTSKEDAIHASRLRVDLPKLDIGAYWKEGKFRTSITKVHVDKTEVVPGTSESYNLEPFDLPRSTRKESQPKRRESIAAGSQLRDNLTSVQLAGLGCDPMLRRRKSMPAEVGVFVPKEKKVREISAVLPQFLHRTLSTKESWTRRRGSAPSPIAVSELCGLAAKDALKHSSGNGGRRKPSPVVTCPHWLAKTTYTLQEKAFPSMFRRSSLPAEVYHTTDETRASADTPI